MLRTHSTTLAIVFALGMLPVPALAVQVLPPDLGITDSFQTMEETEIACRKALNMDADYSGSLLFYVRRCVNVLWKRQQNVNTGQQKMDRRMRMQTRLNPRAQATIAASKIKSQQDAGDQLLQRINQQVTNADERIDQYANLRSRRRIRIRAEEQNISTKQEERIAAEGEARLQCREFTGAQRTMCIRDKMREILEKPAEPSEGQKE